MQLLDVGYFHGDPHPGNILRMTGPAPEGPRTAVGEGEEVAATGAKLAIIDCGCMITIAPQDMDTLMSTLIHITNRNYGALVDDLIDLQILPADCNRTVVGELLGKTLEPYLMGGGLQQYQQVGSVMQPPAVSLCLGLLVL